MLTSSVLPLQLCRRLMQLRHLLLETLTVLVLVPNGDFITVVLLDKIIVDECPDCEMWDTVIYPRWAKKAENMRRLMEEVDPEYWSELKAELQPDGTPQNLANHLKQMANHTELKMGGMGCSAEVGLREGMIHGDLVEGVAVTADYQHHFQLKEFIREYLAAKRAAPEAKCLRLWVDFKDRPEVCIKQNTQIVGETTPAGQKTGGGTIQGAARRKNTGGVRFKVHPRRTKHRWGYDSRYTPPDKTPVGGGTI